MSLSFEVEVSPLSTDPCTSLFHKPHRLMGQVLESKVQVKTYTSITSILNLGARNYCIMVKDNQKFKSSTPLIGENKQRDNPLLTKCQRKNGDPIWDHGHLLVVDGWHSWHVRGMSALPSLLSAEPPVSNISFSGLHFPSCAEIFRWAERRNIHQPGFLFLSKPPSLDFQGQLLTAFGSSGLWCRTSSLQKCCVF